MRRAICVLVALVGMLSALPIHAQAGTKLPLRVAPAQSRFQQFAGVAVDTHGVAYIAENSTHRVYRLLPGGKVKTFAAAKVKGVAPRDCAGIAVDWRDDVYVVGCTQYPLSEFSPRGKLVRHWGSASSSVSFNYAAVARDGNVLASAFNSNTIYRLTARNGSPLVFNDRRVPGPMGVAIDRRGDVYVVVHHQDRVVKLSPRGKLLATSVVVARPATDSYLQGIAVDSHGNVYVASAPQDRNDQVVRLSRNLKTASVFVRAGSARGRVRNPLGLAVDARDNLYVADMNNHRVDEFSRSGTFRHAWNG